MLDSLGTQVIPKQLDCYVLIHKRYMPWRPGLIWTRSRIPVGDAGGLQFFRSWSKSTLNTSCSILHRSAVIYCISSMATVVSTLYNAFVRPTRCPLTMSDRESCAVF